MSKTHLLVIYAKFSFNGYAQAPVFIHPLLVDRYVTTRIMYYCILLCSYIRIQSYVLLYINTLSWMILYHCIVLSIIIHYYITWYDIIYSYISHSMVDRHVATLVLVMQHSKVRFFSFCLCITCWWTDKMSPPEVHVLPATLVCFYKRPSRDTNISLS